MIEDPERAAVGCENHRVVPRVQRDLVDANRRQVGLQARPALRAIDRHEQPRLRAGVQHVLVLQVLGQRLDNLAFQVPAGRLPRLAEVVGHVNVGLEVVLPVPVERRVRGPLLES